MFVISSPVFVCLATLETVGSMGYVFFETCFGFLRQSNILQTSIPCAQILLQFNTRMKQRFSDFSVNISSKFTKNQKARGQVVSWVVVGTILAELSSAKESYYILYSYNLTNQTKVLELSKKLHFLTDLTMPPPHISYDWPVTDRPTDPSSS